MNPSLNVGRRGLLGASVGVAVAAFFGSGSRVFASVEDIDQAIADFAGGAAVEAGGPLSLTTPEIAENGNSVPISFSVESPMTADDHVESVMILAPENPSRTVATFNFTPRSGVAKAATRMRLARTQEVIAVAKTNTGKFYRVGNDVKVTIGGCGA